MACRGPRRRLVAPGVMTSAGFAEWLAYQGVDVDSLGQEQLAQWRALYAEACTGCVSPWTRSPGRKGTAALYAIAVRDTTNVWLFAWTKKSRKGDYYVFVPRTDRKWDPHASFHRDGRVHQKSHDRRIPPIRHEMKPDDSFRGAVSLGLYVIDARSVAAVGAVCEPGLFDDVLAIPSSVVTGGRGRHLVAIEVVHAGGPSIAQPASRVLLERRFVGTVPEFLVTVWEREQDTA